MAAISKMHARVHACVYACKHVDVRVHACVYACKHVDVRMHTHACVSHPSSVMHTLMQPVPLRHAGRAEREALRQCLAAAAKRHAQQGSGCCCVCSAPGDPCVSSSTQEEEAHALRFTAFTSLSFTHRSIQLTGGGVSGGPRAALQDLQAYKGMHATALRHL